MAKFNLEKLEEKVTQEIKLLREEIKVTANSSVTASNSPPMMKRTDSSSSVKSVAQQFGGAVSGVPKSRFSNRALPSVPQKD